MSGVEQKAEKAPDGLRILEESHVVVEDGWIKLSPLLMKSLGIEPGDMITFHADEQGFRVKGGNKPPYFHASKEKPPSAKLPTSAPQPTMPIIAPINSTDISQMSMFEPGVKPPTPRRRQDLC